MDKVLDVRRPSHSGLKDLLGDGLEINPHILSSVPRSIIDTAKLLKGRELFTPPRITLTSVEMMDSMVGLIISKNSTSVRLFADQEMLRQSGGMWFINDLFRSLQAKLPDLEALACATELSALTSVQDSYHFCSITLLSPARVPQALVVVQKAALLRMIDDIVESIHDRVD